jgi:CBS domain-containing protein
MMAMNPAWRQSLGNWQATFTDWIVHTDSQKARLAANLFDFRVIHGDAGLGDPLRQLISQFAPRHESFISHLAGNTCAAPPPIGFFRQLVVRGSGEHAGELDLKHHGLLPITDLARIHALAGGFAEVGTPARLRAAAGQLLSIDGAATLISAFDFLLALRTRHQIEQIINGHAPDNHIDPARLGANERRHLRDVFFAIAAQQAVLLQAYPGAVIK